MRLWLANKLLALGLMLLLKPVIKQITSLGGKNMNVKAKFGGIEVVVELADQVQLNQGIKNIKVNVKEMEQETDYDQGEFKEVLEHGKEMLSHIPAAIATMTDTVLEQVEKVVAFEKKINAGKEDKKED